MTGAYVTNSPEETEELTLAVALSNSILRRDDV